MNFKLRLIIGIFFLFIIFFPLYLILSSKKKQMSQLDKIAEMDSSLKQKVRVMKSKNPNNAQLNKFDNYKSLIIITIIIIMLIIGVFFCFSGIRTLNINKSRIFIFVLLIVLIAYLVLVKTKYKKIENNTIISIQNDLERKFGKITILPTHSKEIIEGNKTEEGNIRNVYLFSCKIEKYNCVLTCYYQEKLIKMMSNSDYSSYDYHYQKIGIFLDYAYDVTNSNLNNLDSISSVISSLSKTRIMNVKLENNYLFIKKETVLYGYNDEDSNIDTDDVKIFYNELIKGIEVEK